MEIRVLGPLEVVVGGATPGLGGSKQRAVLAALVVCHPDAASIDQLVDAVWEDEPPPAALSTLRSYVAGLRKAIEPDRAPRDEPTVLCTVPVGYVLDVTRSQIDAGRFEDAVHSGREIRAIRDFERAARTFETALDMWRGNALQDFVYCDFARAEAERLEELRRGCAEDLFDTRLALGLHTDVIADLEAFVATNPLRERAIGLLMTALYRTGRQADALAAYERSRRVLADELGVGPTPELEARHAAILHHADPGGEARSTRPRRRQHNLPLATTSLVGRDADLDELERDLAGTRILTLTGPGGVGKTRLGVEIARRLADEFEDGAWLCALADARDESAAIQVVASTFGIEPTAGASLPATIVAWLEDRQAIVVLDNAEHLLPTVQHLAHQITHACPGITVLVTSRVPLGVDGESIWPVEPLDTPVREGDESAAVRLFVDRARATRPRFRLGDRDLPAITTICQQLDGLPLAIELAAGQLGSLTPDEIATRLGQDLALLTAPDGSRVDRHRTMHAAIEWSYGSLPPEVQRVFDRLSVFAGGADLDAAHAICDRDGDVDVEAAIRDLVVRSMVTVDLQGPSGRYDVLEPLRRFGADRMASTDDASDVSRLHAAHFVGEAERHRARLGRPDDAAVVAWFRTERHNLRGAVRWAVSVDDADTALRLVAACDALMRFGAPEVHDWARDALAMRDASDHPLAIAVRCLVASGHWMRGDLPGAEREASEALATLHPDDPRRMRPTAELAGVRLLEGRFAEGRDLAADALAHCRRADAPLEEALWVLLTSILLEAYTGETEAALALCDRFDEIVSRRRSPLLTALATYGRGETLMDHDPAEALIELERCVALCRQHGFDFHYAVALNSEASLRMRHGEITSVLAAFEELITHWRHAGNWMQQWTALRNVVELLSRVGAHMDAAVLLAASEVSKTAGPVFGDHGERLTRVKESLDGALDARERRRAASRGHRLSDREAVTHALDAIDRAFNRFPIAP